MRQPSSWLILLILLLSALSLVGPVHAQITMSLGWTAINAPMGGFATNIVTLGNVDVMQHTISLSLVGTAGGVYRARFSPNPVTVPAGGTATSTLTFELPGPGDWCPGESSPGPPPSQLAVQASEGLNVYATASFVVNVLPVAYPLTVSIEAGKSSYRIGETVTLKLNSNIPGAEYYLKVRKPDGSVWASAHAFLPATFTKAAAEPLGTYTAELQAYYCGVAQATATFSVTPDTYDIMVSLAGLPTGVSTALLVDGNKLVDMGGGDVRVLSYPIGTTHTFQVDQYVNGAEGYRYYCGSNSWTATSEGSNAFNYVTQVYLDVSVDPKDVTAVTPSGWYTLGASASIAEVPAELNAGEGTKYVLKEWTVDGNPRTGDGFVLVMDAPHKVVAKYDTMFLLTVVSDYGNPQGQGYYKAGETAIFSVNSPIGFGIQQVFVEWTGDYSGNDPHGSITMDGPKTVSAVWTTSYVQLLIIAGAIVAILLIAALLLWRRGRTRPATVKPTPTAPPTEKPPETALTDESEATSKQVVSVALRCTNCGHELQKGQIYCLECGQKQSK